MSLRRALLYVAVGLATYGAAVIATLPATWLSAGIERAAHERLSLRDPAGTVWRGSGRLFGRTPSGAWLDFGAVRWTAAPRSLLAGALGMEVAIGKRTDTSLELGLGSVTLRHLDVELPGAFVAGLAPGADTVSPEGRVHILAESLRVDSASILGSAEVEWRDLKIARPQAMALGSHVAHLRGAGKSLAIELATLEGPLRVSGSGDWTRGKGLSLYGTAAPMDSAPPALAPFLKGMCAEYREAKCFFRIAY